MIPQEHMLWGFVFSLFTYIAFPFIGISGIFMILFATIFIDVDHWFASVKAGNGYSISKAFKWYTTPNKNIKEYVAKTFFPFHSIEFIFLFGLGIFIWTISGMPLMLFNLGFSALIGCLFHLILDLGVMIFHHEQMYTKISLIYSYFKNKSLLNSGNKINMKAYR